jgi:ABC-type transport system involved in cytochrome c biogenesis permease subunit
MSTQQQGPTLDDVAVRRLRRLQQLRIAMIVALAVQVVVGMANNLWLTQDPPTLETASPQALLSAHVDVAYVLIALAIWTLVVAIRARRLNYILPAATGTFGVLLAYGSGLTYWATEADIWSMFMTIGFAIAVTSYALAGRR